MPAKDTHESASWERAMRLWRKGWSALQQQPFKLQEQLRERAEFSVASLWMMKRAKRDARLEIGDNARFQSPEIVRIVGSDSSVSVGADGIFYKGTELVACHGGRIEVGSHSTMGQASIFAKSLVKIGDFALFSWNVHIQDYSPHAIDPAMRRREMINFHEEFLPRFTQRAPAFVEEPVFPVPSPITIGNDVWLGANVTVFQGVTIGDGCVVGAGSVVTHDLPPYSVAAGAPARVIRQIPHDKQ